MKKFHLLIIATLFLVASTSAFAGVNITFTKKNAVGAFAAATGSKIEIQFENQAPVQGTFLARVEKQGDGAEWMVLENSKKTITLIDESSLTSIPLQLDSYQKLVGPIDQEGGTCAAFAMYHMTIQLEKDRIVKLGLDETGRMKLLSYYISEYYLDARRQDSVEKILDSTGTKYGFKCNTKKFTDYSKALAFIQTSFAAGQPVLTEFDVGSDMVTSRYSIVDFEKNGSVEDPRLWVPRESGQRDGGGHAIVLAAGFVDAGRNQALVLDSDWSAPRVWDLAEYLNEKTRMDLVLFHTCK